MRPTTSSSGRSFRSRFRKAGAGAPRLFRHIAVLSGVLLLLLAAIMGQFTSLSAEFHKYTPAHGSDAENWLRRGLASFNIDTYDQLLAVHRLEEACLQHAQGLIPLQSLTRVRRQVASTFDDYRPGTILAQQLGRHGSFAPAYEAATVFLATVQGFESGRATVRDVVAAADSATDAWTLLKQDTIDREYSLRDQMEKLIVRGATNIATLLTLCAAVVALAAYLVWRLFQSESRRHQRFELLAASIGHDLRSPLQAIQSAAEAAGSAAMPSEAAFYLGVVRAATARLARLVDDILHLARHETLPVKLRPVHIHEWFRAFTPLFAEQACAKGLDFRATCDVGSTLIEIDPDRLAQCIGNLLDNALRHTPAGRITLTLSESVTATRHLLVAEVRDTGMGIPQEFHALIFEPFERVESSAAKGRMGLGLAIVKNLVSRAGGQVEMQSAPKEGSTFRVTIPVRTVAAPPQDAVPAGEAGGSCGSELLLVVDDDASICASVAGLLRRLGFDVHCAADGAQALALARRNSYAAILTDLHMPIMDGHAFTRAIRQTGDKAPFIIVMSAYGVHLEAAPVFDYVLAKPFTQESLLTAIEHAERAFRQDRPGSACAG